MSPRTGDAWDSQNPNSTHLCESTRKSDVLHTNLDLSYYSEPKISQYPYPFLRQNKNEKIKKIKKITSLRKCVCK